MKTTTAVLNYTKTTGAVLALAISIFFGYSVVGYVADTFYIASAADPECDGCSDTGGGLTGWYWGGGVVGHNTQLDGGGGGGVGGNRFTPYCTLSVVQTATHQYTFTWTAPYATSFSINNSVGSVTPALGGSYIFTAYNPASLYTGTAITPYGTVTCNGQIPPPPPPPNPPYCVLTPAPTTIVAGQSTTITWNTTSGVSFSVNNGVGSLTPVGGAIFVVSPATTTTYIGTVTGTGYQTAQCQTTVIVTPPSPPTECTLEITKSANKTTLAPYETVEYTINIKNVGDAKCTGSGVKVLDVLDTNLIYQSETHSTNINAGYAPEPVYKSSTRTLSWNAWDMDPGETGWIKFVAKAATPESCSVVVPNKAKVTAYEYNNFQTFVESNTVTVTVSKDCAPPPPPPPPPQASCGIDIALVLDASGTIDAGEAAQMKTAVNSFVDTLIPATPTLFSVTKFNTTASVLLGFSGNATTIKSTVNSISTSDWTNWEQGLVKGNSTYDPRPTIPNVIIFASDGQPNRYGVNGTLGTGMFDAAALAAAVTQANAIKASGTRIITLGVGTDSSLFSNLLQIASPASSYTVSDYASLNASLRGLSSDLCGGTITVKKVIDLDGNLTTTNDQTNASGWIFNVAGTNKVTGTDGMTVPVEVIPGTYSVIETQKPGHTLVGAVCTGATHNGTFSGATISGIQVGASSIVSCVFYNKPTPPAMCSAGYWKNHLSIWYNASESYDVQLLTWLNAQGPGSEALRNQARDYLNAQFPDVECNDTPPPPTECTLEITKSANKTTLAPYETVEYTINIKNVGDAKCTGSGVKVLDVLDTNLIYQSETHSTNINAGYAPEPVYKSSTRTLSWNAWDMDPGEIGWIKFVAKAATPESCTIVVPNKAKVTAYEYNNFQTFVESNTVTVTVTKSCSVPVPYCTMSASGSVLSWNSTNVNSVSIDNGVGSVALSGSTPVSPALTTTYTGTFTGPGGTVTCNATVPVHTYVPQCTLTVSASKIKTGQSVMVSWTSQNVLQGFINKVGTTTPVSGGSAEVFPSDNTTFTGTFTGSYGSVTCSVPVEVEKGSTGCQGNCGGGLNQPNVVMLQKPPEAPLAFVTLEQIPYTGFEAGKALTLAFWLAIGLLAAVVTYFTMGHRAIQFVFGGAGGGPIPNSIVTENRDQGYRTNGYAATVASVPVMKVVAPQPVAKPAVDGIPELGDVIESRAHGAGVLMSPEAVTMTLELSLDRGEVLRQFGEILNEAVRVLPREDGWVMLTSERFENLSNSVSKPSVEAILNSVMPPAVPTEKVINVEMPMASADDQSVVMSLAQSILVGNRDQAYATLRSLETGRANAASVMTVIAGACDQLYRARRHGLTTVLSVSAIDVSDEKLTKIVEVFAHGMDAAYANPFTSLKLAVAQAFEARG